MESTRSSMYSRGNTSQNVINKVSKHVLELWGEFLRSTIYVLNRTASTKSDITPYEKYYGTRPNIDNLRVIGCKAYVHVPDCKRQKLDPKAEICWFVGYCEETKAWLLWNPTTRKFIKSRDVTFEETSLINDYTEQSQTECSPCEPYQLVLNIFQSQGLFVPESEETRDITVPDIQNVELIQHDEIQEENHVPMEESLDDQDNQQEPPLLPVIENEPLLQPDNELHDYRRRSERLPVYTERYNEYRRSLGKEALLDNQLLLSSALFTEAFEPQSYKEALNSKDADKWMKAFQEEYDSHIENKT